MKDKSGIVFAYLAPNILAMSPKFKYLSAVDQQKMLIHYVQKFLFGLNIEASTDELQKVREELKEIIDLLHTKENKSIDSGFIS